MDIIRCYNKSIEREVDNNDYDFNDLMENCWGGAIGTLTTVSENNKEDALMNLLEDINKTPTLTEVNDYLAYESDEIYNVLDIKIDE